MKLTLIVLSCRDITASKWFYESLGLVFQEEKHGKGPRHFSAIASGVVLKLFPISSQERLMDGPRRLGFSVHDLPGVTLTLIAIGTKQIPTESVDAACFQDPDGRIVEVTQEP